MLMMYRMLYEEDGKPQELQFQIALTRDDMAELGAHWNVEKVADFRSRIVLK
jgi:hypothetical protein